MLEQERKKIIREQTELIDNLTDLEKIIDDKECKPQLIEKLVERIYVQEDSIEIVFKCSDIITRIEELIAE